MERKVKCKRCGDKFESGTRGALPRFCPICRPVVYKERVKGTEKVNIATRIGMLLRGIK